MRNRGKPASVGAESFQGPLNSDAHFQEKNIGRSLLWAPFERHGSYAGIFITGLIMEMIGTLLFSFFTNMVISNVGAGVDPVLKGFLVGIVSASTYYMAAGGWRIRTSGGFNELPRHLSWSVSFVDFLLLRTGFLILLAYWAAQTAGSAVAAGLLRAFVINSGGAVVLPLPTVVSLWWGAEIIGSATICLIYIYSKYFGGTYENEENEQRLNATTNISMARFGLMVAFFPVQSYYFDPVLYLTALIATCTGTTCTDAVPFNNAPVFYIFVPLIGSAVAAFLYYVLLAIGYASRGTEDKGQFKAKNSQTAAMSTEVKSYRNRQTQSQEVAMGLPKMN